MLMNQLQALSLSGFDTPMELEIGDCCNFCAEQLNWGSSCQEWRFLAEII